MVLSKLARSILSCAIRAIEGAKEIKTLAIAGEAHSNRDYTFLVNSVDSLEKVFSEFVQHQRPPKDDIGLILR